MNINKYLVVLPGIILAFVLYTLSQGFNNILGCTLILMGVLLSQIAPIYEKNYR